MGGGELVEQSRPGAVHHVSREGDRPDSGVLGRGKVAGQRDGVPRQQAVAVDVVVRKSCIDFAVVEQIKDVDTHGKFP